MGLTKCFCVHSGLCSIKVGAPFVMNTSNNDQLTQDLLETNVGTFEVGFFHTFGYSPRYFSRVVKIPDTYQGCTSSQGQSHSALDETHQSHWKLGSRFTEFSHPHHERRRNGFADICDHTQNRRYLFERCHVRSGTRSNSKSA